MTRARDQRIHADALRRHWRSNQARRFKRHAIILAGSIALGGLFIAACMLAGVRRLATMLLEIPAHPTRGEGKRAILPA